MITTTLKPPLSPLRRNRDELREALSNNDLISIPSILHQNPTLISLRNNMNQNLPLHDLFDQHFNITDEMKDTPSQLFALVQKINYVSEIFIAFALAMDVQENAAGLLEYNREKIDFVNYRSRTPMDMFLAKFEVVLNICCKFSSDNDDNDDDMHTDNDSAIDINEMDQDPQSLNVQLDSREIKRIKIAILDCMKGILQRCIQVCKKSWKDKGCNHGYTIMHTAVGVFPLLKIHTFQYLIENFEDKINPSRDLLGRSLFSNIIHETTKRRQWGDWKERFQRILKFEMNYCLIRDCDGRLPIHVALDRGLEWDNGLEELIDADASTLLEPHPVNGLYPFAGVALSRTPVDLDLIFKFLVRNPLVVLVGQKRYVETREV